MANNLSEQSLYECRWLSISGEAVVASNGMYLPVSDQLEAQMDVDMLVVMASFSPEMALAPKLRQLLRRFASTGRTLAAVDTGSYILAHCDLLNGYRATIHWEFLETLAERFPRVNVLKRIYVRDQKRLTAAGGTACLDMMLDLIQSHHGESLAKRVCDQFIYHSSRSSHVTQRLPVEQRIATDNPRLLKAVALMEEHIEEGLAMDEIASRVGISQRQLERCFKQVLNKTPAQFYREVKLERAHNLLRYSDLPLTEIAIVSGFGSVASFSRAYSGRYGSSPGRARLRGQLMAE